MNHDHIDYDAFFAEKISELKDQGNYREFAELARQLYAAAGRSQGALAMFPSIFDHFRQAAGDSSPAKK